MCGQCLFISFLLFLSYRVPLGLINFVRLINFVKLSPLNFERNCLRRCFEKKYLLIRVNFQGFFRLILNTWTECNIAEMFAALRLFFIASRCFVNPIEFVDSLAFLISSSQVNFFPPRYVVTSEVSEVETKLLRPLQNACGMQVKRDHLYSGHTYIRISSDQSFSTKSNMENRKVYSQNVARSGCTRNHSTGTSRMKSNRSIETVYRTKYSMLIPFVPRLFVTKDATRDQFHRH